MSSKEEVGEKYVFDNNPGPVYGFHPMPDKQAMEEARKRDIPQIIEVLVWPYSELTEQCPVLRRYYALNLPQAAIRAAEIEIRLREQELRAVLVAIRPATDEETNTFFRVMDKLEAAMTVIDASQVKEPDGLLRTLMCGVLGGEKLGERSERVDPNTYTEGSVSATKSGRAAERKVKADTNTHM